MTWTYRPDDLAAALEEAGFDVDRSSAELSGVGGSLTARRDRADRTILVAVDAGGRLRIDVTSRLAATAAPAQTVLGGVTLRETAETIRTRTLTGQLAEPEDLPRLLADLIRPSAGTGPGSTPQAPPNQPPPPISGPW